MKFLFKTKDKEKNFWDWFQKNEQAYFTLENEDHPTLFNKLAKQLSKVDENLTFEFSYDLIEGKRDFIISADGMVSSFSSVIHLVESAPDLPRFTLISFRQKADGEQEIEYGDVSLTINDIFFDYEYDATHNVLDVDLYIKDYEENDEFVAAAFLMLDSLLGEYTVGTTLGDINFGTLVSTHHLKRVSELEEVIKSTIL
ncbi:hypothetical protein [Priestia koreensis]|uniref:hypothetical protein n=1 Tax=Priestia koreensis TaxID=284581 RepID=UPI00345830DC